MVIVSMQSLSKQAEYGAMIDLHTHSNASDGTLTPRQLIEKAASEGLSAIALTDHDSIEGIAEAREAAGLSGIRFIPGIEIEIAFEPGEFHLLGLDMSGDMGSLEEVARALSRSRDERNKAIIDLFKGDGITIDYEQMQKKAGTGMIGRPHIAAELVSRHIVKNKQAAFDKYLAKGRPYYVRKACVELSEALAVIKDSGGLAFVAHPMSLFASWKRLRSLFVDWKDMGLDGIEAWHPTARVVECARLDTMARESGFRVSAGSDYHGVVRPDRRLGHTAGNRPIGDEFLSCLER